MSNEVLALSADCLAQPILYHRATHIVAVFPSLVAGVVWRVDVDALYAALILRQERPERGQIVALDDEVFRIVRALERLLHIFFERVIRDRKVVVPNCRLSFEL